MTESKDCIVCWEAYFKKVNCSRKERSKSTCCSKECNHVILKQTQQRNAEKRKWVRFTEEQKERWKSYLIQPWHKSDPSGKYLQEYRDKWGQTWNKWLKWFRKWEVNNFWRWWAMKTRPLKIQIRESREMKRWIKFVFERDNYTCQECGIRTHKWLGKRLTLHAHHNSAFSQLLIQHNIQSFEEALQCKELWNIDNGQTLCADCRKKTDSYKLNQYSSTGLGS